jgi:hypothetical protein
MIKRKLFCLLISFITLTTWSCKSNEKPVNSPLDSASLRNGSVSMYNIRDKSGKVIKLLQNHILVEALDAFFVQQYSAAESEEIIRVSLSPKTLHLNHSEIASLQNPDKNKTTQEQKILFSVDRSGGAFFLTDSSSGKVKTTKFYDSSFVMEQEVMVYLLNCFSFDSSSSAQIRFVNVRTQKEGTETILVKGKETKMYNKQSISAYKVSFSSLGGTAWYMEEEPHMLLEADLPFYTITLVDWNGI